MLTNINQETKKEITKFPRGFYWRYDEVVMQYDNCTFDALSQSSHITFDHIYPTLGLNTLFILPPYSPPRLPIIFYIKGGERTML